MKTHSIVSIFVLATVLVCGKTTVGSETIGERRLSVEEYRDKMAGGWVGQMIGVGWAGPTEFEYKGRIIPEEDVPVPLPKRLSFRCVAARIPTAIRRTPRACSVRPLA